MSSVEYVWTDLIVLGKSTPSSWICSPTENDPEVWRKYTSSIPDPTTVAYPLAPLLFPLINEVVYIVEGLNIAGENPQFSIPSSYYITNIGIWNHPHHNAYPLSTNLQNSETINDYETAFSGTINDTTDDITIRQINDSTGIYLGETFQERSNIHPLLPFEGDFI